MSTTESGSSSAGDEPEKAEQAGGAAQPGGPTEPAGATETTGGAGATESAESADSAGPEGDAEVARAAEAAEAEETADAAEAAEARESQDAAVTVAATSQLSTAPSEERLNVPSIGVIGWVRWFWRQLTSMRVALILLFLLSMGAIPGSVIPQTSVDSVKVDNFREKHDILAPIYDKLQLFDVYSSVWFSAIYILLFISLVGCIIPRSWQFVGQLRSKPPRAPRRLDRMPAYTTWRTETPAEDVLESARGLLGKKRFRVHRSGDAITSEKGYLREAGNLMFHIALIVLLLAFAAGQLWKSEGGKLIVQGDGFANTLTQYDDFKSGSLFDQSELENFGFSLKDFHASFEKSGPEKGTARGYRADVSYWEGADAKEKKDSIEVNDPLRVGNSKVYLLGNGFAPVVSVKDGQGKVAYRGPVAFLPQDANFTSSGVVKVADYRDAKNRKDQLGFQGFFVPTFGGTHSGSMFSQSPEMKNPVLFLTAYHGDLGLDYGAAQNVYQLDTKNMKQFKTEDGRPVAKKILPGGSMKLPNGAGTLEFEGVKKWASFQISHEVGNAWALGGALAAIFGLAGSLFIQRRRVWVRAVTGKDGRTVVEMAGLGRSESAKLPEELGELAYALADRAPIAAARASAPASSSTDESAGPESAGAAEPSDSATAEDHEADSEAEADHEPGKGDDADSAPSRSSGQTPAAEGGAEPSPRGEERQ